MRVKFVLTAAMVVSAAACGGSGRDTRHSWLPSTPYDRYVHSLGEAGLDGSAVVRDWVAAGNRALEQALPVFAPFTQVGYFDPADTRAVGYRIEATRGQKLIVEFGVIGPDSVRLFADLFRVTDNRETAPVHVASGDSLTGTLEFVAYWDGAYILRLQPEILRGGRYRLAVRNAASLAFPVFGHDSRAIQSVFGDPRDGGSRNHQGVDIFADRNTAVVAPIKGTVTWVGTNRLGGNVVWLRDTERGYSYYFAHLERQIARRGQRVEPGDTIGLVGNSGNARTTPPHLHFGVYVRGTGAVNPYGFLHEPQGRPAALRVDTNRIGQLARINRNGISLRRSPSGRGDTVVPVERNTPVRLLSGIGDWFEVELPDGLSGFIPATAAEMLATPLDRPVVASGGLIHSGPSPDAVPSDSVGPGTSVQVLGRFNGFLLVDAPRGVTGWLSSADVGTAVAGQGSAAATETAGGG